MLRILDLIRKIKHRDSEYVTKSDNSLKFFWWNGHENVGDALNFDLASRYMGLDVEWVPNNYNKEYYMVIGSIIQKANSNAIIWGAGLISDKLTPYRKPKEILAVRGPLTRAALERRGIGCPKIFGDPALLLPKYYYPTVQKKYKYGIIPHYADMQHPFFKQETPDDFLLIDPGTNDVESFINSLLSCEKIVSSSLHGLIFSDAYAIPSAHVRFSKKVFGDNFKFCDYFLSVGRNPEIGPGIELGSNYNCLRGLDFSTARKIDTEALESSCPF